MRKVLKLRSVSLLTLPFLQLLVLVLLRRLGLGRRPPDGLRRQGVVHVFQQGGRHRLGQGLHLELQVVRDRSAQVVLDQLAVGRDRVQKGVHDQLALALLVLVQLERVGRVGDRDDHHGNWRLRTLLLLKPRFPSASLADG